MWFITWLGTSSASIWIRDQSPWLWPFCETLHFIGLALVIGFAGVFDLRLLGALKQIPIAALKRCLPWAMAGLTLNLLTGVVFFTANPYQYAINPLWWGQDRRPRHRRSECRAVRSPVRPDDLATRRRDPAVGTGDRRGVVALVVRGPRAGPPAGVRRRDRLTLLFRFQRSGIRGNREHVVVCEIGDDRRHQIAPDPGTRPLLHVVQLADDITW